MPEALCSNSAPHEPRMVAHRPAIPALPEWEQEEQKFPGQPELLQTLSQNANLYIFNISIENVAVLSSLF